MLFLLFRLFIIKDYNTFARKSYALLISLSEPVLF